MTAAIRLSATYNFDAARQLPNLPDGHKCKRLHEHSFRVEISIEGPIDARGFVIDYAELDAAVLPLIDGLDHRFLNEIEGLENPTSEVIALWLKERIAAAIGMNPTVRVYESPRHWVEA
jgi:6-pyruvoyltetrahydropterin/6-carboxytetrahydropterin synthase